MLQELEVASVTPRGAYDLVSLWAELRWFLPSVVATQALALFAPVRLQHCYTSSLFTMPEKIDQDKETVSGIILRDKKQKSGIPFEYRR